MVERITIAAPAHEPPGVENSGGSAAFRAEQKGRRQRIAMVAAIAVVALTTRLATSIGYVEDLDSLHFALAMVEFDIGALQPHFPGYVVFVALARLASALAGGISGGFALVGALATAMIAVRLPELAGVRLVSARGALLAALALGSGMLWLYANRYMPDLLGTALLLWSALDLSADGGRQRVRGALLAGLLAGTRLSYLPFLIPFAVHAAARRSHRRSAAVAFIAGIIVWALPLVATTGLERTIAVARNQTTGHFDEFGGTIRTEPDLLRRASRMASGLWTDGLGGWAPSRGLPTIPTSTLVVVALAAAATQWRRLSSNRSIALIVLGCAIYLLWIYFFQNVIHHSRHLLPIVPLLLAAVVSGIFAIERWNRSAGIIAGVALLVAHGAVGARLAWQHRSPSAIAQVSDHLRRMDQPATVVSTSLVNYYLASTGVDARFLAVDRHAVLDSLQARPARAVVSVGDYRSRVPMRARAVHRFYHNPHVNRIWPMVETYEYDSPAMAREDK